MGRKSFSFHQLLTYIQAPEQKGVAMLHNLLSTPDDVAGIQQEFISNARLLPPRKNGNLLYHEILSFGTADRSVVTPAILEDLTRRYLELRAPNALAYAQAHFDTENTHVHLVISANDVGSAKRLRLSRQQFQRVKRSLQAYQRERSPQLQHSLVPERSRERTKTTRSEAERARRLQNDRRQAGSHKELLCDLMRSEIANATSGAELFRQLQAQGYELYKRGQSIGIRNLDSGRRHRLKTLGIDAEFQQALANWRRQQEQQRKYSRGR